MNTLKNEYQKGATTVVWEPGKCIHSEKCWRGLIEVFNPKKKPWINVDGSSEERIIEQVNQCPSGALSIQTNSNIVNNDAVTTINAVMNGPLLVSPPVKVTYPDGSERLEERPLAFCRCGHSSNKPYCDGSHKKMNFEG